MEAYQAWQKATMVPGRWLLYRRYLKAYRRLLPVDEGKLSFYLAWAALRRLSRYGLWLRVGPWATGGKQSSLRYLRPDKVALLGACFEEQTGVPVHLD